MPNDIRLDERLRKSCATGAPLLRTATIFSPTPGGRDVTKLLDEAFAKAARLPDHEQDAFARWLESERR